MSAEVQEKTIKPIILADFLVRVNRTTNKTLLEADFTIAAGHKKLKMLNNRDFQTIKRAIQARKKKLGFK